MVRKQNPDTLSSFVAFDDAETVEIKPKTAPVSTMLPWDEYCKIRKMNPSTLVCGLTSMKAMKAAIDGEFPEESNAMRLGTGIHSLLLTPEEFESRFVIMPDFANDPRNMTTGKNPTRSFSSVTTWVKEQIEEFSAAVPEGVSILPHAEYVRCLSAINAVRSHHSAPRYLEGAKEVTVKGTIDGVECKGRVDVLGEWLVDVKTTQDAGVFAFGRSCANLHYPFKMAFYRELIAQMTGEILPVAFVAVETNGLFDCVVHEVPDAVLDQGFRQVREQLERYKRCKESGVWPGKDGGADSVTLYTPNWAMENDNEMVAYE